MSARIKWVEFDPDFGPPKPAVCIDGPGSHTWTVAIEEGRLTVWSDECRLCSDSVTENFPPEDFELDPVKARLAFETSGVGDSTYTYVRLTAP